MVIGVISWSFVNAYRSCDARFANTRLAIIINAFSRSLQISDYTKKLLLRFQFSSPKTNRSSLVTYVSELSWWRRTSSLLLLIHAKSTNC